MNHVNIQSTQRLQCDKINKIDTGGPKSCSTEASPAPIIPINATLVFLDFITSGSTSGNSSRTTLPSSNPSSASGGLSRGAKSGIGVGVDIVALAIFGVTSFFGVTSCLANRVRKVERHQAPANPLTRTKMGQYLIYLPRNNTAFSKTWRKWARGIR